MDLPENAPPALRASRFGECLLRARLPGGWGLAAAWSPSGHTLAVASQGSQLTLLRGLDLSDPGALPPGAPDAAGDAAEAAAAAAAGGGARLQHLPLPGLPLKCLAFLTDSLLVGGGFDFKPLLFARGGGGDWQCQGYLQGGWVGG